MAELVADKRFVDSPAADQDRYVQTMARLTSGGFIAAWDDLQGTGPIYAQLFDATGAELGTPLQLSATGGLPSVTGLANGGFAMSWRANDNRAIMTRVFDATGKPVGPETQIPVFFPNTTQTVATPNGYVVGWASDSLGSVSVALRAFDASGAEIGKAVTLATSRSAFALAEGDDGRVLVALGEQNPNAPGAITVRTFDAATGTLSADNLISLTAPSGVFLDSVDIVQLASGKLLLSWIANTAGVRELNGAIFTAAGVATADTFTIGSGTNVTRMNIAALDDGGFVLTYSGVGGTDGVGGANSVVAQVFDDRAEGVGVPFTVSDASDEMAGVAAITAFGTNDFAIGWTYRAGGIPDSSVRSYFSFTHFQLISGDGWTASLSGRGLVFGTNSFQDITILDEPSDLVLDASFNRGGDIVRLPGKASDYSVVLAGSTARFSSDDTHVSVPIGRVGMAVVFDDGARNLIFDTLAMAAKIGGQAITGTAAAITAAADLTTLPTGADPAAAGRLIFNEGGDAKIAANLEVFGTNGAEHLVFAGGTAILDGSFNRGGDTVSFADSAVSTKAYRSGSSVILITPHGNMTIPVGTTGMVLDFAGDERVLRFDSASSNIKIGNETITATSAGTADPLDVVTATALALSFGQTDANLATIA